MNGENRVTLELSATGDSAASNRLWSMVYDNLRALANHRLSAAEGRPASLQPTELVHEVFVKMMGAEALDHRSHTHFFAIASRAMQQVLTDHVRGRDRQKRGGGWHRITLDGASDSRDAQPASLDADCDALEDALCRLSEQDPRAATALQLRFFGGLKILDIAECLAVSERTVRGDLLMARSWLEVELAAAASREKGSADGSA